MTASSNSGLTSEQLRELAGISTPTVSNAIQSLNVQPHNVGISDGSVSLLFPEMGPIVGYAVTARVRANEAPSPDVTATRYDLMTHVLTQPEPRILVIENVDEPPYLGAFWGEVQSTLYKRLGCVGTVTNGGVRDLAEVRKIGFAFCAGSVVPSRAYIHVVEVGRPVMVAGVKIAPGDLIHADEHGFITIPAEVAGKIPEAARAVEEQERRTMAIISRPGFTPDDLR